MNPQQRCAAEHKQRRQTADDDQDGAPWLADIDEIASRRVVRVVTLAPPPDGEAAELVRAATVGDPFARRILGAAEQGFTRLRRSGVECGVCRRRLRGTDFTLCIAIPETPNPTVAVVFGLCPCCRSTGARAAALTAARSLWPDLRPIEVHATEGRA
jgi:hypothetical protein